MKKPLIFGHRGAMGYSIENTISSFKKALEMGVDGIETDIRLTKDKKLICFHDTGFYTGPIWHKVRKLTLTQLKSIKFKDNREIPTLNELFIVFKEMANNLRYSFDIENKKVGLRVINLAKKYLIFNNIEITDTRTRVLSYLREQSKEIKLIHTIPHNIIKINSKTINFDILKELNIQVVNVKDKSATLEVFKFLVDNGFKCYVWGVNKKYRMKKILNLKYKDEIVEALYTDYPDILIDLKNEMSR